MRRQGSGHIRRECEDVLIFVQIYQLVKGDFGLLEKRIARQDNARYIEVIRKRQIGILLLFPDKAIIESTIRSSIASNAKRDRIF